MSKSTSFTEKLQFYIYKLYTLDFKHSLYNELNKEILSLVQIMFLNIPPEEALLKLRIK